METLESNNRTYEYHLLYDTRATLLSLREGRYRIETSVAEQTESVKTTFWLVRVIILVDFDCSFESAISGFLFIFLK